MREIRLRNVEYGIDYHVIHSEPAKKVVFMFKNNSTKEEDIIHYDFHNSNEVLKDLLNDICATGGEFLVEQDRLDWLASQFCIN